MENVLRSRPQPSLLRRALRTVAAPLASIALLSGGGWGAYHYYDVDVVGETPLVAAHAAPSAKDELKMLFASDIPVAEPVKNNPFQAKPMETQVAPKKLSAKAGRYAMASANPPALPPLVQEKSAKVDYAAGNRYATALAEPELAVEPIVEPVVASKADDLAMLEVAEDIARGQEPHANPLRVENPIAASSDRDARAAFGAALTHAPSTATQDLAAALDQARPLQQSPRYRPGPPLPSSTPPLTARIDRPSPPIAIQVPRQQPLRQRSLPVRAPAPTVAPPVSKQATSYENTPPGLTPTPGLANHPGTGRPGESLLEGAQSPSITIQKLAPEQIQVGKRCTFAIRIQNSGQRTAQNVQIRDEIPLGTELVGTAPRATVSGSEIVWDLGTLSPGEERTVEMELLPKEEGELGSVARVTLSAQASAKSRCTRPELALRLTSKPQVHLGDQHIVQIEISNPGSGDATGVMLLETIPNGVSHEAGPALEFEIGTLRAGENRRMELVLTAEQAGKIHNVMTARADASLQVEADCEFEVIAPKLQLSIAGPQRRYLERPATYRVSVDNPGTAAAKDVQLVTHLPEGMQFVSANNMGEYDSSTHSVHWSLAELPASERGTVELVALPIESGTQTLQVSSKARQGLEDRTDKQVVVEGLSALMFEVVDVEGLIEIGGETTYEIRVQNQGSKTATNVQIVAVMQPGLRAISGQGETRHAIEGERVIFAPLPQLAPKAETTFRIQAQGVRPGDQRVRVQITSDDLQQPITKEVSTRVYADE